MFPSCIQSTDAGTCHTEHPVAFHRHSAAELVKMHADQGKRLKAPNSCPSWKRVSISISEIYDCSEIMTYALWQQKPREAESVAWWDSWA